MVPNPLQLGRAIGLVVEVKNTEIGQHCAERSKYHTERADHKEAELPKLQAALDALKGSSNAAVQATISSMNKGGYNLNTENPIEQLENDIRIHRNKALTFKYLGEHLLDAVAVGEIFSSPTAKSFFDAMRAADAGVARAMNRLEAGVERLRDHRERNALRP